jgi:hypothetical protein
MKAINKFFLAALVAAPSISSLACGPTPPPITGTGGNGGSTAGTGGSTAGTGGSTAGTGGSSGRLLPCDVDAILRQRCQACHSSPSKFGAPMPLTTMDDILRAAVTPGSTVAQRMKVRINDVNNPMPPKGQTPLKDAELATLNRWLDSNTPAGTVPCTNLPPPGDLDALTGPEYLPCTPNKSLVATGSGPGGKFNVPSSSNLADYRCFSFQAPFGANEQSHAWAPIIDDDQIIHHWLLFGASGPARAASGIGCQLAVENAMVAGWAPGGANGVNPPDVSQKLTYPWYILQVHYANQTGQTRPDGSGVAFCTGAARQNVAGIVTLGTNSISIPPGATAATATGLCNGSGAPSLAIDGSTPITIVSTSPHMHMLGTKFRTEHVGFGDLSNIQDWNFDVQIHYPTNPRRTIRPGELLRTTCTFRNPGSRTIGFGPGTDQEMCYDFVLAYPYDKVRTKCGPSL